MNKKIILCILTIIIGICIFKYNKKNILNLQIDSNKYFISVNGKEENKFPESSSYDVTVTCTKGNAEWDYQNWQLKLSDIESDTTCNISFETISPSYLSDHIKSLNNTDQGKGKIVSKDGYRYIGFSPNNYIIFNNELWRIIGVFDSSYHGITDKYLLKIIRNDSIGDYFFEQGNWEQSDIFNLLNKYYNNTDNTIIGINDRYRSMIESVKWYSFGDDSVSLDLSNFNNIPSYEKKLSTINANIGLMYASDYGCSMLEEEKRDDLLNPTAFDYLDSQNIWLFKNSEWTMTGYSKKPFLISAGGFLLNTSSTNDNQKYGIRPVVYLKSDVYKINGDGSKSDPYIISR